MTHEFKEIITAYALAKQQGIPAVLATVVDVEGSAYRRPGVSMLILSNGKMLGAVSGGCVEKEVYRQSLEVFETTQPKVITYDGKYRLGCEGVLYILIEFFDIEDQFLQTLKAGFRSRKSFVIDSYYSKTKLKNPSMGSKISIDDSSFSFAVKNVVDNSLDCFSRELSPCFRLVIVGTEHDAVKLCHLASSSGWEVIVVGTSKSSSVLKDFPGASELILKDPDDISAEIVDHETVMVLMTHNFAKDLLYLQQFKNTNPSYIGLLGPARRREKMLNAIIEYDPDISEDFIETIHGPAGLNIGAETPQEIAISIIAEILSITRNQKPMSLLYKKGAIHDDPKRKEINAASVKS